MKLQNKKTGKIGNFCYGHTNELCVSWQKDDGFWAKQEYDSLAKLNEDWEDYEELKKHYVISEYGGVFELNEIDKNLPDTDIRNINCVENIDDYQSIGNYFETEEEAERAVEKLKAWRRLKDKGFKFIGVRGIGKVIDFDIPEPFNHVGFDEYVAGVGEKEFYNDLLLLFGGEE